MRTLSEVATAAKLAPHGKAQVAAVDALQERGRTHIADPAAFALLSTLLRCVRLDGSPITRIALADLAYPRADLIELLTALGYHGVISAFSTNERDLVVTLAPPEGCAWGAEMAAAYTA